MDLTSTCEVPLDANDYKRSDPPVAWHNIHCTTAIVPTPK